jgi:uncharacterized protein (TIGR03000 family)
MSTVLYCAILASFGAQPMGTLNMAAGVREKETVVRVFKEDDTPAEGATVRIRNRNGGRINDSKGRVIQDQKTDPQGRAFFPEALPPPNEHYVISAFINSPSVSAEAKIQWVPTVVPDYYTLRVTQPASFGQTGVLARAQVWCCEPDPCCCSCCCCSCWFPPACVPFSCSCTPCDLYGGDASANVGSAALTVSVPENAIVFVNGKRTTKTGTLRAYVSPGLAYGYTYKNVVRAQVLQDGNVIESTREVLLCAGDSKSVAFDLSAKDNAKCAAARLEPRRGAL